MLAAVRPVDGHLQTTHTLHRKSWTTHNTVQGRDATTQAGITPGFSYGARAQREMEVEVMPENLALPLGQMSAPLDREESKSLFQ